jgi:hypothetical protein
VTAKAKISTQDFYRSALTGADRALYDRMYPPEQPSQRGRKPKKPVRRPRLPK